MVAPTAAAQIESYKGLEQPDLIEITGHVGEPFASEPGGWNLTLGIGYTPTVYRFHLFKMRILNSGRLPDQVLFAVEPYDPNFTLIASPEQIAALALAGPDDVVTITGYRRQTSRVLMVTDLSVAPPATPGASPAALPTP